LGRDTKIFSLSGSKLARAWELICVASTMQYAGIDMCCSVLQYVAPAPLLRTRVQFLILSLSLSRARSCTHVRALSHTHSPSLSHERMRVHVRSLVHACARSLSHTLSLSVARAHACACAHTLSQEI